MTDEQTQEQPKTRPSGVRSDALFGTWQTGKPPHTKPGTRADCFLCVRIDSEIPCVLTYMHEREEWTSGGGDAQKVRCWMPLPSVPNATHDGRRIRRTVDGIVGRKD